MSRIGLKFAMAFIAGVTVVGSGCYSVVKTGEATVPECVGPCGVVLGLDGGITGAPGSGYSGPPPVGAGGAGGQANGADGPISPVGSPPASCPSVAVSRFNELMIVDPQVTNDARASNQSAYHPWSFRQRLEALVPEAPEGAGALASAWLDQWATATSVPVSPDPGAATVSVEPRPAADQTFLCPWLIQSAGTGCDFTCSTCSNRRADLTLAPFRLLAIVNRLDAAVTGSAAAGAVACGGSGGELRFVYGAADPQTSDVLPFTVVFEYAVALRPGETMRDWAAAWHALGQTTVGSPAFTAQLDVVVSQALARGTLQRVRTNEVTFGSADGDPWDMRQFVPQLTDAGTTRLVEVAVPETPRLTLATSSDLAQWIDANSASVVAGQNALPASMLASSAPIPTADFSWHTGAADPATAAAFNQNTCNGCHGGRTDPTDIPFQHVAPPAATTAYGFGAGAPAAAQLSHFLHNPGHNDELARRESVMAGLMCAVCSGTGGAGGAAAAGAAGAGGSAGAGGAGGAGTGGYSGH